MKNFLNLLKSTVILPKILNDVCFIYFLMNIDIIKVLNRVKCAKRIS